MAAIDAVLGASVDAVKRSGALENGALMATVSVLNADGTADLTRAGDTYPNVRLLSGYLNPSVGDNVEMLRSAGGWVCVGALRTNSGPRIQSGRLNLTFAATAVANWNVTFPKAFDSVPNVVANIASNAAAVRWYKANVYNESTTGFTLYITTTDAAATAAAWSAIPMSWIATTY
ncbi:hypothetical protein ACWGA9_06160 [Streptomyces sp. NPDC054950]